MRESLSGSGEETRVKNHRAVVVEFQGSVQRRFPGGKQGAWQEGGRTHLAVCENRGLFGEPENSSAQHRNRSCVISVSFRETVQAQVTSGSPRAPHPSQF